MAPTCSTCEDLQPHVRTLMVEGVEVRTLDIEGLSETRTDYRAKDWIDREALQQILLRLRQR
ncbi:hypothetical protein JI739_00685 [Ramlibacter sp. AW1]|uniref:Uncharacterized protein n=1 Tax=Ramlibacter aurantiacus TaxID=2801330 RepID=A0A937D1J9_9BURK|nr:hypothetical protein [Ramlibacter aurantiacus]MBL0418850.1 hypothetical protein [Ramlibacter aurantiacus]